MIKKVVHTSAVELLKVAGLFKFVWLFGTTHNERPNKIHVHGYPFSSAINF